MGSAIVQGRPAPIPMREASAYGLVVILGLPHFLDATQKVMELLPTRDRTACRHFPFLGNARFDNPPPPGGSQP